MNGPSILAERGGGVHLTSGVMTDAEVAKEEEMEAEREKEREEIEAEEISGKTRVVVEAEFMVADGDAQSDDSGDEDGVQSAAETVNNEAAEVPECTEVRHQLSRSSEAEEARRKKKARAIVNLTTCDYSVVKDACKRFGWRFTNSERGWSIKWTDRYLLGATLREMKLARPQRINHFPAMCEIAFKCRLATNLNRLRKLSPDEYDFYPETFVLPEEMAAFTKVTNEKKNRTYIVKPNCGSQGNGIFLTRSAKDIPKEGKYVAQRYMNKPLLIDNLKFDLRIYVLITSVAPLRLYVLREGLARFCTQEYEGITAKNRNQQYMHLTNYAINKHNEDFEAPTEAGIVEGEDGEVTGGGVSDGDSGSKRSISSVRRWLDDNGFSSEAVWQEITALICKTVIAALPANQHAYRLAIPEGRDSTGFTCFTVLGFDVILDSSGKPNLIEVNELPSFETDSLLDQSVKMRAVHEALQMVSPTVQEGKLLKKLGASVPGQKISFTDEAYVKQRKELVDLRIQQEQAWCSLYERIHPAEDTRRKEVFDRCIQQSEQAYKNSFYGPTDNFKLKAEKEAAAEAAAKAEQEKLIKAKREKAAALARAGPVRPVANTGGGGAVPWNAGIDGGGASVWGGDDGAGSPREHRVGNGEMEARTGSLGAPSARVPPTGCWAYECVHWSGAAVCAC